MPVRVAQVAEFLSFGVSSGWLLRPRYQKSKKIKCHVGPSAVALFSLILFAIIGVRSSHRPSPVADEAKPAAKKEPWKPEDFIYSEAVGQYRVSPDGKWLAWTKSSGDKDKDGRIANLYLSSLTGDAHEIALTRGSDNNMQPKWSPDGEKIAFLSTRARPKAKPDTSPMQLWLINAHGGEAWHLTDLAHSPKQAEWLDKDTIVFSAPEDPALYEMEMKKKKDDSDVIDDADHEPPVRLYKVNVKDGKITRLTTNTDWIEQFEISHDGKYAVASHAEEPALRVRPESASDRHHSQPDRRRRQAGFQRSAHSARRIFSGTSTIPDFTWRRRFPPTRAL